MGRLFWKFFLFIWLGQLTTIWGVGGAIWIMHFNENQKRGEIDNRPPATFVVESAAATLQYGGMDAVRSLLRSKERRPVFVVDEAGKDLLGRTIAPAAIAQARSLLAKDATTSFVKQVPLSGHTYLLFSPMKPGLPDLPPAHILGDTVNNIEQNPSAQPARESANIPFRMPSRGLFPWFPVVAATIASFILASLSAWYFSKPIRHLRSAFELVASGNLDVNLNSIMGGRRDDLADLGRDFDRMTRQLRTLIEGQRKLLHDISHELRSPLARLQVAIGLARQQPEKIESSMTRIERESIRIDQLVGELLTLSKLDAGVTNSMKETINADELLADIVDDAQFEARAQGKDVEFSGKFNASIQGSAELLHRAIENVIRNAIKHAPEGSSVIVQTNEEEPSQLKISILDTGSGVDEAELGLIFEPFYRSNSPGNNFDGHGLGLAIARRVLEAHGGSIRATNRATGGLCVEMIIPVITYA